VGQALPVINAPPNAGPPPFERIAIVGFGLIGASLAMAIRRRWQGGLILAVDRKHVLEAAMREHAADVAADDLGMVAEADLIVLAAPVRQNLDVLERLPDFISRAAVVTDVGSTKAEIVSKARSLPARLSFAGGHPLAGSAAGGIGAARPDLFDGRPWILTTPAPAAALDGLESFVSALGAVPLRMDADAHDTLLAYLSHLPQLTVSALMHIVGERVQADGLALSGKGLRDTTRLAMSPPGIWRDVAATNSAALTKALDDLIAVLGQLRDDLAAGEALEQVFASAARWKSVLEGSDPGGAAEARSERSASGKSSDVRHEAKPQGTGRGGGAPRKRER
jgi:prephenate dehydrogenase